MARLTGEDFNDIFATFERSAFRLETLPHYAVPTEADAFAAFLAGQPYDLAWHQPWLATMRGVIEAGRTVQRVRVMEDPPTPYQRFELAVTPHNLAVGEDIRVLNAAVAATLALPSFDFWLFDERRAVVMRFDFAGVFGFADVTEEPSTVAEYLHVRDRALANAVPYSRYRYGGVGA